MRIGGVAQTIAPVATANAMIRACPVRNSPHTVAASTIDGPMMLRMSTFSSAHAGEWLTTNDWNRNTNASTKISRPRRCTALTAARLSPVRRAFDPADIATAIPARKRNSGAPKPPRISDPKKARDRRSATRVQLSMTCASIMISTATPRSTSRYVRRPGPVASVTGGC